MAAVLYPSAADAAAVSVRWTASHSQSHLLNMARQRDRQAGHTVSMMIITMMMNRLAVGLDDASNSINGGGGSVPFCCHRLDWQSVCSPVQYSVQWIMSHNELLVHWWNMAGWLAGFHLQEVNTGHAGTTADNDDDNNCCFCNVIVVLWRRRRWLHHQLLWMAAAKSVSWVNSG